MTGRPAERRQRLGNGWRVLVAIAMVASFPPVQWEPLTRDRATRSPPPGSVPA